MRTVAQSIPTPEQFLGFIRSAVKIGEVAARERRGKLGTLKLLEQLALPQVITEQTLNSLEDEGYAEAVELIRMQTDWYDRT